MNQATKIRVQPGSALGGKVRVPGDKSISHRALIFGALADGTSEIEGWLPAGDTLATLDCVGRLGIQVDRHDETTLSLYGRGLRGLHPPTQPLNCVNAGTAIRLLAGVMAGQSFASVLDGSAQLRRRPMRRITEPLRLMGAQIQDDEGRAPLRFYPSILKGIEYEMPVASAQVKSGLLLAGLFAQSRTTVIEPGPARDHTERMLAAMGADVRRLNHQVMVTPVASLNPLKLTIPGDLSSAAFLLAAATLVPHSAIQIEGINVNETRTGIVDVARQMGGAISAYGLRDEGGEPVADLHVNAAALNGINITGSIVVRMIDEFPVLMVMATQADGVTVVSQAEELRVKETDRIAVMAGELGKMGVKIEEKPDGFAVNGCQRLRGATVDGHDDHRVAMSLVIAGLVAEGETLVEDARCIHDSFPRFVETMQALGADVSWVI